MHFHLPKPLHGWRAFVGEVGIIVIGVLIALSAEQVVERVHDRRVAQEAREAIQAEFGDNLASLAYRARAEPCISRRLSEVRQLVMDWGRTGGFKTPQWVAQAPMRDVPLPRYRAALSAGRLTLLPNAEQYRMGTIAAGFESFADIQEKEQPVWSRLRALQMGADVLSTSDRTMILQALQEAADLDYLARGAVRQQLPFAKDAGYEPNFSEYRRTVGRTYAGGHFTPSICTSIDTPPNQANQVQVTPLPL